MTRNLETADTIAKLTMSISYLFLYSTQTLNGAVAGGLMILSFIIILIYGMKMIIKKFPLD